MNKEKDAPSLSESDAYGLPNDLHAAKAEIHEWRQAAEALGILGGGPDALRKRAVELRAEYDKNYEFQDQVCEALGWSRVPKEDLLFEVRRLANEARSRQVVVPRMTSYGRMIHVERYGPAVAVAIKSMLTVLEKQEAEEVVRQLQDVLKRFPDGD